MPESDISFAKIAANPTQTTWSQAYNAGKLFAVLSLEKKTNENPSVEPTDEEAEGKIDEKDFLAILGKSILDTLENEYFTLEAKALDPIKNAILITGNEVFDLNKPLEQRKCFNYKNLQPLWAKENLRKNSFWRG
jgi:hypothetical protein